jgi:hypothetical protein
VGVAATMGWAGVIQVVAPAAFGGDSASTFCTHGRNSQFSLVGIAILFLLLTWPSIEHS